jgi:ABC-2 type transport system permease protein
MLRDSYTVFWKELRDLLCMRQSVKATLLAMFLPAVFIGAFFPMSLGARWVETPSSIGMWFMLDWIMVSGMIADSFAGERERHTLETLLATRLSEASILMGKLSAAVLYGITLAACGVMVSLISVSVTSGQGRFLMFSPIILFSGILTGLVTAVTASAIGILISLKATSARQVQQMMGFAMMFLFFIPVTLAMALPRSAWQNLNRFKDIEPVYLVILAVGLFVLLDVVLFIVAVKRFKRWKMIVE